MTIAMMDRSSGGCEHNIYRWSLLGQRSSPPVGTIPRRRVALLISFGNWFVHTHTLTHTVLSAVNNNLSQCSVLQLQRFIARRHENVLLGHFVEHCFYHACQLHCRARQ